MKTLLHISVGVFFLAFSNPLQALYSELDQPGLAYPAEFDEDTRKELQQILEHKDYEFLGGSAINWMTNLNYKGSTKSLNSFLHALSNCEGVITHISFVESIPKGGNWQVYHSAHENGGFGFRIRVSVNSNNIQLTELVLPEIRGSSKVKQNNDDIG